MTTNPATRPFWVVVGSGIDVRGIDVLGQIFDFSGIEKSEKSIKKTWQEFRDALSKGDFSFGDIATVYKGNIIKNLIMDCQSYTKYRPNETTGGIFVSWRRKEELPTGA